MTPAPSLAGLSVVLRSTPEAQATLPLVHWLPTQEIDPVWVPVQRQQGVTKVMPVLWEPKGYPHLLQAICQRLAETTLVEWRGRSYVVNGVELEPDDLYVVQVALNPEKPFRTSLGRALHALCLKWIGQGSGAIATGLHANPNTAFTVSLKRLPGQSYGLQIRLLDKALLSPLLWGLSTDLGKSLEVVHIPCWLGDQVDVHNSSSFKKLLQVEPQEVITLNLLSPTSFKQGKATIQSFPLPELVFSSLLRRWNAFASKELQFPNIEWQGMVSAFDLKTKAQRMKGGPEIGAQGWVKYRFPDPEQARVATILAHYALFAGIGRKTAMGMGQAQLQPNSDHP